MPNHVENRIRLDGEPAAIKAMLEAIQNDELGLGTVDFNKIIPMPESLNIEAGSRTDRGLKAYQDFVEVYTLGGTINMDKLKSIPKESEEIFLRQRTDIRRDEWTLGKAAWNNIQNYGAPTWYEWCNQNWGTKWNAYGYDKDTDYSGNKELWFQTAWDAPHTILEKLTEMFPTVGLEHSWADEDLGVNCGRYSYRDGERTEEYLPENAVEAMDFAASVWEYDLAELGYVMNKTGSRYLYLDSEDYEEIELLGRKMLFSNERLTENDIPDGLYCYDLRHSDDGGRFAAIEPHVRVNHGGTVITDTLFEFGKSGYIPLVDDTEPNFTGEKLTIGAYLENGMEENLVQGEQTL